MPSGEVKGKTLRLLKKGHKGLVYALFSRFGLVLLMLLVQIATIVAVYNIFKEYIPHYYAFSLVFSTIMVLVLINSRMDPSSQVTWLIIIMIMPVFGSLLYIYTQSDFGHRALKKRTDTLIGNARDIIPQNPEVMRKFREECPGAAAMSAYLRQNSCRPVYAGSDVKYFPSGEDKFAELLVQLRKAEQFIFLEYFIIDEGIMWGQILEILAEKAKNGVEVRVMYDGTCEFSLLPSSYPKKLQKLGISCKVFAPLTPFLSTHYNYRDHRKILVIDGKVAFTGGINLADEYINVKERFGHWKDTAIMVSGDAVRSFTMLFLQMWNINEPKPDFGVYVEHSGEAVPNAKGYVIPYGDCPLSSEKPGERVYMDILYRATRYVHIMTPYLVLDGAMQTALEFAAERGVDVSLILPGIPDKKATNALAKNHYKRLLDHGVKIYEYTPGFVHAKVFVSDDREAVVGTINLDYRSLYHHFECAAYMYGTGCIPQIEEDFRQTLEKCRRVTYETIKKENPITKLVGFIMKAIAPLI